MLTSAGDDDTDSSDGESRSNAAGNESEEDLLECATGVVLDPLSERELEYLTEEVDSGRHRNPEMGSGRAVTSQLPDDLVLDPALRACGEQQHPAGTSHHNVVGAAVARPILTTASSPPLEPLDVCGVGKPDTKRSEPGSEQRTLTRNDAEDQQAKPSRPVRSGACCDICGHSFRTLRIMSQHMVDVHQTSRYVCQLPSSEAPEAVCGKPFRDSSRLRDHMETHQRLATLKCEYDGCPHVFKTEETLQDHMQQVHRGPKKYCCTYKRSSRRCRYSSTVEGNLARHIRKCHSDASSKLLL